MGYLSKPRRVLVTGASRGIGEQAARRLGALGHYVVAAGRSEAELNRVAEEIRAAGGSCEATVIDVASRCSVERGVSQALRGGAIDVLVNNAGLLHQRSLLTLSEEECRAEMEVNYLGVQRMTRALLPSMLQRGEGLVVNVSSLLGSVPTATTVNYCATKAALNAFSHALRGEVAERGVQVTVFVAPHTDTKLGRAAHFAGVPLAQPTAVAHELVRALDRAPVHYAAGGYLRVGLLLARLFPRYMARRMACSVQAMLDKNSVG